MSAVAAQERPAAVAAEEDRCVQCGAELQPDQEWCLECGAARTVVHRPPDARIGAAIVAGVVLVALIALAIVLLNLSTTANRTLQATTAPPPQGAPAIHRPGKAAASATIADWPVGLSGFTVVLGRRKLQGHALALARRLAATGLSTGVLNSSQHPRLRAGYYVVFSGRYPTAAAAQAAAAALRTRGQPQALARQVARPGGL